MTITKAFVFTMFVTLLGQFACNSIAVAASLDRIGWKKDGPYFLEEKSPRLDGEPMDFFLKAENAENWTSKISYQFNPVQSNLTIQKSINKAFELWQSDCISAAEREINPESEKSPNHALFFWQCNQTKDMKYRVVSYARIYRMNDFEFISVSEQRQAFNKSGKYEFNEKDSKQLLEFTASLAPCMNFTDLGCVSNNADVFAKASVISMESKLQAEVDVVEKRGRALYWQDQEAWHSTDFLLDKIKRMPKAKSGGFVSISNDDGTGNTYFVGKNKDKVKFLHRVERDKHGSHHLHSDSRIIPPDVAIRMKAIELARKSEVRACSERINTAVIPTEDREGWWVYHLTSTTVTGVAPLGVHTRTRVNSDATEILATDYSTRSCFAIADHSLGAQKKPDDYEFAFATVSHVVSELPWETHVFQSLLINVPMIVSAPSGVWKIHAGNMERLDVQLPDWSRH